MAARIFREKGKIVGLTNTSGVYIDDEQNLDADASGPKSARMVLRDPTVDLAVLETARGGMLREGLGFDRCDVGIVLDVTADHLGLKRGEVAALIAEGVHSAMGEGVRAKQVEIVLDELEATRHALGWSNPGDLIIVCVDQHASVMSELEDYGTPNRALDATTTPAPNSVSDPDFVVGAAETDPDGEPSLF